MLFLRDGKLLGVIAVADTIRETSRAAIRRFNEMGLRVVMLTGANKVTAEAIRKELDVYKRQGMMPASTRRLPLKWWTSL